VLLLAGLGVWGVAGRLGVGEHNDVFSTQGCGNSVAANLFTVPAGVRSVQITATGSAGEDGNSGIPSSGGTSDVVRGTPSGLSAGQVLDVCVDFGSGAAGIGNEGNGGAGGGASGVALGSDFSSPVLVAAGGGGSSEAPGSAVAPDWVSTGVAARLSAQRQRTQPDRASRGTLGRSR
jgi:hypothetical protein